MDIVRVEVKNITIKFEIKYSIKDKKNQGRKLCGWTLNIVDVCKHKIILMDKLLNKKLKIEYQKSSQKIINYRIHYFS